MIHIEADDNLPWKVLHDLKLTQCKGRYRPIPTDRKMVRCELSKGHEGKHGPRPLSRYDIYILRKYLFDR